MKRNKIIIGCAIAACVALGIFAIVKLCGGGAASGDDESADENVPTVVTVQTGKLTRVTLRRYVAGYGAIEAAPATANEPAANAPLAAPSAGVVTKVNVVEGQAVTKGDVLLELNSSTTTAENAAKQVARQKELYAQQNTSLKNLQDAEMQLALLRVTAPLAGTVTRVNVKPGQAVDLNTVVAEVMDLNRLAVSAQIPAAAADELKTGEEVQISGTGFQSVNGQEVHSTTTSLSFVSPAVDANDGTVLVRALVPVKSGLRPGQFVQLKIVTAVQTNCLAAPAESVVTDINGHSVIALVNGDDAVHTPVQTGLRENGWVEITGNGLTPGDSVVTVGAYGLPDKTKINVENSAGGEVSSTNSSAAK